MRTWACVLVSWVGLGACASDRGPGGAPDEAPSPPPASTPTPKAPDPPPSSTETPCATGIVETCASYNVRSFCVVDAGVSKWRSETCASGCFAGKCVPDACADECVLGARSAAGVCRLWDMKTQSFVSADPAASMHDRARDYDRLLRDANMPHGQVMNVHFTDATRTTRSFYSGFRDAAIWTGSALAAQAWRLSTTREPDAAAQVEAIVATLHRSFNVSGDPGYLARVVAPSSAPLPLTQQNPCSDPEWHCNKSYDGKTYDWLGGTSRDQNTGVMLGYTLAYLAATDDAVKKTIRGDVVTMARELIKVRKDVPARVVVNGLPLETKLDLENVILAPSEMAGGRLTINLSTSTPTDSEMAGMREFFPDFSVLVKQVLGVNVPIPRSSSAIMLGGIVKMAIVMAADDPAMKKEHQELSAYYDQHAADWLTIAEKWTFETADGCGKSYFANHITFIMAYVWASLEKGAALGPRIRDKVVDGAMWKSLKGHKNAYFAFLWGGTRASSPAKTEIDLATSQLSGFQPGPRVYAPRDSRALPQYMPHDTGCTAEPLCDIDTLAVDVKDRRVDDFIWQRQPWQLYDGGDPTKVYPGVDYLAAYWAARRHGFLADDRGGTCTRLAP